MTGKHLVIGLLVVGGAYFAWSAYTSSKTAAQNAAAKVAAQNWDPAGVIAAYS